MAVGLAAVCFVVLAPPASAGVGIGVTPQFPPNVTVGNTSVPATLQIVNTSTPPESDGTVTLNTINLVPACGTTSFTGAGDCPVAAADPGVFQLSATGTGETGTACANLLFNINITDAATGQVSFTSTSGPVVLSFPRSVNAVCRIDFTFDVAKKPTHPAGTSPANTASTAQIAFAQGTAQVGGAPGIGTGSSLVVVGEAQPAITTAAPATGQVGGQISDTATLSATFSPASPAGPIPTGSITFNLFGPNDTGCTATPVSTSTVAVNSGTGSYPSAPFTPTSPGTYRWIAAYSGDANNIAASTACNDTGETTAVSPAPASVVTTASGPTTVGGTISDQATLAGAIRPTGTITFSAFGPNDASCASTPAFTSMVSVNAGDGTYPSGPFIPTAVGTFRFVAAYSGDPGNPSITTACGDANESAVVNPPDPSIVTAATATASLGGTISDSATLSGGVNPTGTITFQAYGPTTGTCDTTTAFSVDVAVNGNGTYNSGPFAPTNPGIYLWRAFYLGDANNNRFTTPCGDTNESSIVVSSTTLVTMASPSVAAGGQISDSATLAGGARPTGTITFTLFGPNNATCSGTAVFTSTKAVSGNGVYPSDTFTATLAGTYRWVATYSGDSLNTAATNACGAANESAAVTMSAPAVVTQASAPVAVGGQITDTAALSGGFFPTGTIVFTVFGPNDATCATTPAFTSTQSIDGNGAYTSDGFTVTAVGTYRFVAAYSGDASNGAAPTACNDANESVTVTAVTPSFATTASPSVTVGGQISDTATLSGGAAPTGTITFAAFGPNDAACTGSPAFTSTRTVSGNGDYFSDIFTPAQAGTYQFVATYSGDANNAAVATVCGDEGELVVVSPAMPTIVTAATATAGVGGSIGDTATISGGFNPTGTITFELFGPDTEGCGAVIFSSAVTVNGNGSYTSASFTPTATGSYFWEAFYNGDINNNAVNTGCGDSAEISLVITTPTITTATSPATTLGASISDTATLSGQTPTGTITFSAFGPNDTTGCATTPVFTSTVTAHGDGTYSSSSFTPAAAGTYLFVAAYSGDFRNTAVTTACGDESVVVNPAVPTLVTIASAPVPIGGTISDSATLSGGFEPGGTITFTVFGPSDASCANAPEFTSMTTLEGNGTYSSDTFTATAAGTYRFVAAYSGDANNAAVTTRCNDPNESVVVAPVTPTLVTTASGPTAVAGTISDTATLSGGSLPTGTITFELFGPDNVECTGSPVFTSTTSVAGNGTYDSAPFSPLSPGIYNFEASYSGDANNAAVALNGCGVVGESVLVTPARPTVVTSASAAVSAGGTITDAATLSGGMAPTGTIVFTLFGPADSACAGTPIFTSTKSVTGDGTYPSDPFTTVAAGTYNFVASYRGDANNASATTACGDEGESVSVTAAPVTVTTLASGPVELGGAISDTATVAGGVSPTGTITFTLFGAAFCEGPGIFTSTKAVTGNGVYVSDAFTPPSAGQYHWTASYGGDTNNQPVSSACNDPGESSTVLAVAALATTASAPVTLGASIADTATLSGAAAPTGTITFQIFGPNDRTGCDTTPTSTSTVSVDGNGTYTSPPFTPTAPGAYQFVAFYSGDAANAFAATSCSDPLEIVDVNAMAPTLTTQASAGVALGSTVSDVATLAGATATATGTITFDLFGPNDVSCANAPVFSSVTLATGNGRYSSGPFIPVAPGAYQFMATYGGDALNAPVATVCRDAFESVVVQPSSPALTTTASPSVTVGGSVADAATLAGGTSPTGTITFQVFGPDDATGCDTTPASTSTVAVEGNGTYNSTPFTPSAAGVYQFVAAYGGDANNNPAGTSCLDLNEAVLVTALPPPTTSTTSTSTTTSTTSTTVTTSTTAPATAPPTAGTTIARPRTTPPLTVGATVTTAVTSTTTTSTTVPETTTTATITTLPSTPAEVLKLDRISAPPGSIARAFGRGCVANSPVTLSIASMTVGNTVAGPDGSFSTELRLNVAVGHYTVTAQCGVTLSAVIDVVLTNRANTPTSTAAILLILLLLMMGLLRSQLSTR